MKIGQSQLKIESVKRNELMIGIGLVGISFVMPLFFNADSFRIFREMALSLHEVDLTHLIFAAVHLVGLNSLRAVPHYVGSFLIGESIEFRIKGHNVWIINAVLIITILLLTYTGIEKVHGIHYDFGLPAIAVTSFVVLFHRANYRYVSVLKRAFLIALVLVAFQFLDIMPCMEGMPVGRGEASWDIKLVARVLGGESELNILGGAGVFLFALFSVLIFLQLRIENKLRELNILKEQNHEMRMQAQYNEMQNRMHREMQYLVHDLKSPLTAMQTLVGVLKMKCEAEDRKQEIEYLSRIEHDGEQMNRMISEMLYEDSCSPISAKELIDVALAQSSVTDYAAYVQVENEVPDALVSANRMLFPRVLVNLMQNSAKAMTADREPEIRLLAKEIDRDEVRYIQFSVSDNGRGIEPKYQKAMWDYGFSGQNSSGLGLPFVRNVVEKMGGTIEVATEESKGTTVAILLRREGF